MRTWKMMAAFAAALTLSIGMVSCGDDNNPPPGGGGGGGGTGGGTSAYVKPQQVFTAGVPKSVAGAALSYNEDGLLTSITSSTGAKVTFDYLAGSRANAQPERVRMTVVGSEYGDKVVFDMQVAPNGCVTYCEETEDDGEKETWRFNYNSEGNLIGMIRSEGGNETTTITYQDGDIVSTKTVSEMDRETSEYTVAYTSQEVTTPLANKGCVMLFDDTFGVDMDEMQYAYYAGMLGKPTKHLPVMLTEKDRPQDEVSTMTWTLNADGLPTLLTIKEPWDYEERVPFQW